MARCEWAVVWVALAMGCGSTTGGAATDAGPQCGSRLQRTPIHFPARDACVYPETCDYTRLMRNVSRDALTNAAVHFTPEGILWIAAGQGVVLRGVLDERPRIERIDIQGVDQRLLTVSVRSEQSVWIVGRLIDYAGSDQEPNVGSTFHWDGCRWQRDEALELPRDDNFNGPRILDVVEDVHGETWAYAGDRLVRRLGTRWMEAPFLPDREPVAIHSTDDGTLFVIARRSDGGLVLHTREGDAWREVDRLPLLPTYEYGAISHGRSYVAFSAWSAAQSSVVMTVWREGRWQTHHLPHAPVEDWGGVALWTMDVDGRLVVQSRAGYWQEGREGWQPEALQARLRAQGRDVLDGFSVIASQRTLDTLDGVRWYLAGERLVGCRLTATEARCIGAVEGVFAL